jgi:hypothetical protein
MIVPFNSIFFSFIKLNRNLEKMGAPEFDQQMSSLVRGGLNDTVRDGLRDFGENINTRFAGNEIYDFAMAEVRQFDWNDPDLELAKTVARQITTKASKKGVEVGSAMIGKVLVTWAAGLGMAGQVPLAVVTGGVGVALDWGMDKLLRLVWPKQDEKYEAGDYIVLETNFVAQVSSSWRRRMPDAGGAVEVGIATGANNNGYVPAFNMTTGQQGNYPVQSVARVPEAQVAEIEAMAPSMGAIRATIKEMIHPELAAANQPPHAVGKGKKILYNGELCVISRKPFDKRGVPTLQLYFKEGTMEGNYIEVPVGDPNLTDVWRRSANTPLPGTYANFSQESGIVAGMLVWFASRLEGQTSNVEELGCVWACKHQSILVCSAFDGSIHKLTAMDIDTAPDDGRFMSWKAAVVDGNKQGREAKCPGNNNLQEACYRKGHSRPREQIQSTRISDEQPELGHKVHTTGAARAGDIQREIDGAFPGLEPGEGGDRKPPLKDSGNGTMYILLAGGVVLALMFSQ